jgi:hypothetical protein
MLNSANDKIQAALTAAINAANDYGSGSPQHRKAWRAYQRALKAGK